MPQGLPRKIRVAFIVQAALASLAIVLGVYLISAVLKYSLINTALQEEADHFWQLYAASSAQPPPNTYNLRGYLVLRGHSNLVLPEHMRGLPAGFHEIKADNQLVLVDERSQGRLYLAFLGSQAERMVFWFGTLPIVLTLLFIYAVSWWTYRASKRLVSPVSWLAQQVARWDPRSPDTSALAADRLPKEVQGEARQLAVALHGLSQRVSAHIARERDFTRDASHELRTPLTVIRVACDMAMADPDAAPRTMRSLQRIQRAGRDMEAVIDAFLILARDADVEPQSEVFDLCELVVDEADYVRTLLDGKPVTLSVACAARPVLDASPRVMRVVVGNLLRNACAYTDDGTIQVTVEEDGIRVSDTGIGMSRQTLERAFEPFYRADHGRPEGTGLGLSIVRRLCDRFGWRVELASVEGEGTSAVVRFAS